MTFAERYEHFKDLPENELPAALKLIKRVIENVEKRNFLFVSIDSIGFTSDFKNMEIGCKYLTCNTVNRHNGTDENVSVDINVEMKTSGSGSQRLFRVRVPKNASDKVINNRIDKAIEQLK